MKESSSGLHPGPRPRARPRRHVLHPPHGRTRRRPARDRRDQLRADRRAGGAAGRARRPPLRPADAHGPLGAFGPPSAFVVAFHSGREQAVADEAFRILPAVSGVAPPLTTGIGRVVAGRVLAPVRLVRTTTAGLTERDLTQRIPVRGKDDVAALAETFNAMLHRLERAFAGRRQFADDAGHELRTPLTIVRGHLELTGDDPAERAETVRTELYVADRGPGLQERDTAVIFERFRRGTARRGARTSGAGPGLALVRPSPRGTGAAGASSAPPRAAGPLSRLSSKSDHEPRADRRGRGAHRLLRREGPPRQRLHHLRVRRRRHRARPGARRAAST